MAAEAALELLSRSPEFPNPDEPVTLTFRVFYSLLSEAGGRFSLVRFDTREVLARAALEAGKGDEMTITTIFLAWAEPVNRVEARFESFAGPGFVDTDLIEVPVNVAPPPPPAIPLEGSFAGLPASAAAPATLTLQGLAAGGEPDYDFIWDFGDGTTASGPTVTHTWVQPRSYEVRLTIRDRVGAQLTASQVFEVKLEAPTIPTEFLTIPVLGEAISAALTYLGQLTKAFADFMEPAVQGVPALVTQLPALQGALDGLKLSLAPLATLQGEGLNTFLRNLLPGQADMGTSYATALRVGSPEWQGEVRSTLQGAWFSPVALLRRDLLDRAPATPYIDPGAALALAIEARDRIELVSFGIGVATVLGEIATLGQVEAGTQLADRLLTLSGVSQFAQGVNSTIFDVLLAPGLRYGLNAQFQPNIPSFPDLINMVVKEVIPLETFRELAPLQGYSSEWADRIWLAHFFPPTRGELHLMLHRGLLTEAAVTKLETLVDLDPRFREINRETGALGTGDLDIWAELRYRDPSITEARFMFEQAAIDRLGVQAIVQRSGMAPPFVEPLTNFLTTFQDRIWRRQFLLAARAGYRVGALTEEELLAAVAEARFPPSVAEWIVKGEGMRRKVRDFMRAKPEAGRELTPAEVVRAVVKKLRDATWGKTRLVDAGFDEEDAELKLALALEQPGEAA